MLYAPLVQILVFDMKNYIRLKYELQFVCNIYLILRMHASKNQEKNNNNNLNNFQILLPPQMT